ncbi:MAG: AAA family ATPase [Solirubrobacterales bacterium]
MTVPGQRSQDFADGLRDMQPGDGKVDAALRAAGAELDGDGERAVGLRTRGVLMERVRPIRWLWKRRIPCGLPSLVVGEEGVGKGTVMAWLVARASRGELEGDLKGEPVNTLIIGDEDGFESVWVPRLYAAGGDLGRLRTLDDGEYLDDLSARADDLSIAIERDEIGLIVLDQVLDHVNGGTDGSAVFNPKNVRQAMMPLRRVAGHYGIAAVGSLHPNKRKAGSFRELVAGSHQFNAVSRSSLLLGEDPEDKRRRVLVRGKGNHSAVPRSFEFRIGVREFELNDHGFEMPVVEDAEDGDRTVEDLLATPPAAPVTDPLADKLSGLLTDEEQPLAHLARGVDRDPKDGSVRNALDKLRRDGRAEKGSDGGWLKGSGVKVQGATPIGGCTSAPPYPADGEHPPASLLDGAP